MSVYLERINRRDFVSGGLAATAALALPAHALDRRTPYRVLFDRDSAAGNAFAEHAARRGARVVDVGDDLAPAWMRVLEPRLRRGDVALAGLTNGAVLFCLEFLARDYGLRTAYRKEIIAPSASEVAQAAVDATSVPPSMLTAIDTSLVDLNGNKARSLFSWMLLPG